MTSDMNAFDKLGELLQGAEQFSRAPYDHPAIKEWRLTVSAILESHYGRTHDLVHGFRTLPFRAVRGGVAVLSDGRVVPPPPTEADHQAAFQRNLGTGKSIISAALAAWLAVPVQSVEGSAQTNPVVQITNSNHNSNTASSLSVASAVAALPLADLLALIDQNQSLAPEQKEQAKEHLEDLDGELSKANPRWEKVKPALKFLLDTGKEVAIKTIGAVAAKMLVGP